MLNSSFSLFKGDAMRTKLRRRGRKRSLRSDTFISWKIVPLSMACFSKILFFRFSSGKSSFVQSRASSGHIWHVGKPTHTIMAVEKRKGENYKCHCSVSVRFITRPPPMVSHTKKTSFLPLSFSFFSKKICIALSVIANPVATCYYVQNLRPWWEECNTRFPEFFKAKISVFSEKVFEKYFFSRY